MFNANQQRHQMILLVMAHAIHGVANTRMEISCSLPTPHKSAKRSPHPSRQPRRVGRCIADVQHQYGYRDQSNRTLHVGTGESTSISASRFECDGTGAIIEQTTGTVDNIMTKSECEQLPNFEFGVALPATTATKQADALCKTGDSYQPYGHHYVIVSSGSST